MLTLLAKETKNLREQVCNGCKKKDIDCVEIGKEACEACNTKHQSCKYDGAPEKPKIPRGVNWVAKGEAIAEVKVGDALNSS
jgi:hypothetical protein